VEEKNMAFVKEIPRFLPAETEVVLAYRPEFEANISRMRLRSVTVRANLFGLIESTWIIWLWENVSCIHWNSHKNWRCLSYYL